MRQKIRCKFEIQSSEITGIPSQYEQVKLVLDHQSASKRYAASYPIPTTANTHHSSLRSTSGLEDPADLAPLLSFTCGVYASKAVNMRLMATTAVPGRTSLLARGPQWTHLASATLHLGALSQQLLLPGIAAAPASAATSTPPYTAAGVPSSSSFTAATPSEQPGTPKRPPASPGRPTSPFAGIQALEDNDDTGSELFTTDSNAAAATARHARLSSDSKASFGVTAALGRVSDLPSFADVAGVRDTSDVPPDADEDASGAYRQDSQVSQLQVQWVGAEGSTAGPQLHLTQELVVTARLVESSSPLRLLGLLSPGGTSSRRSSASSMMSGKGKGLMLSKTMPKGEGAKGATPVHRSVTAPPARMEPSAGGAASKLPVHSRSHPVLTELHSGGRLPSLGHWCEPAAATTTDQGPAAGTASGSGLSSPHRPTTTPFNTPAQMKPPTVMFGTAFTTADEQQDQQQGEDGDKSANRDFLELILSTLSGAHSVESEAQLPRAPSAAQLAAAASLPRTPSAADLAVFAAAAGLPIDKVEAAAATKLSRRGSSSSPPPTASGSSSRDSSVRASPTAAAAAARGGAAGISSSSRTSPKRARDQTSTAGAGVGADSDYGLYDVVEEVEGHDVTVPVAVAVTEAATPPAMATSPLQPNIDRPTQTNDSPTTAALPGHLEAITAAANQAATSSPFSGGGSTISEVQAAAAPAAAAIVTATAMAVGENDGASGPDGWEPQQLAVVSTTFTAAPAPGASRDDEAQRSEAAAGLSLQPGSAVHHDEVVVTTATDMAVTLPADITREVLTGTEGVAAPGVLASPFVFASAAEQSPQANQPAAAAAEETAAMSVQEGVVGSSGVTTEAVNTAMPSETESAAGNAAAAAASTADEGGSNLAIDAGRDDASLCTAADSTAQALPTAAAHADSDASLTAQAVDSPVPDTKVVHCPVAGVAPPSGQAPAASFVADISLLLAAPSASSPLPEPHMAAPAEEAGTLAQSNSGLGNREAAAGDAEPAENAGAAEDAPPAQHQTADTCAESTEPVSSSTPHAAAASALQGVQADSSAVPSSAAKVTATDLLAADPTVTAAATEPTQLPQLDRAAINVVSDDNTEAVLTPVPHLSLQPLTMQNPSSPLAQLPGKMSCNTATTADTEHSSSLQQLKQQLRQLKQRVESDLAPDSSSGPGGNATTGTDTQNVINGLEGAAGRTAQPSTGSAAASVVGTKSARSPSRSLNEAADSIVGGMGARMPLVQGLVEGSSSDAGGLSMPAALTAAAAVADQPVSSSAAGLPQPPTAAAAAPPHEALGIVTPAEIELLSDEVDVDVQPSAKTSATAAGNPTFTSLTEATGPTWPQDVNRGSSLPQQQQQQRQGGRQPFMTSLEPTDVPVVDKFISTHPAAAAGLVAAAAAAPMGNTTTYAPQNIGGSRVNKVPSGLGGGDMPNSKHNSSVMQSQGQLQGQQEPSRLLSAGSSRLAQVLITMNSLPSEQQQQHTAHTTEADWFLSGGPSLPPVRSVSAAAAAATAATRVSSVLAASSLHAIRLVESTVASPRAAAHTRGRGRATTAAAAAAAPAAVVPAVMWSSAEFMLWLLRHLAVLAGSATATAVNVALLVPRTAMWAAGSWLSSNSSTLPAAAEREAAGASSNQATASSSSSSSGLHAMPRLPGKLPAAAPTPQAAAADFAVQNTSTVGRQQHSLLHLLYVVSWQLPWSVFAVWLWLLSAVVMAPFGLVASLVRAAVPAAAATPSPVARAAQACQHSSVNSSRHGMQGVGRSGSLGSDSNAGSSNAVAAGWLLRGRRAPAAAAAAAVPPTPAPSLESAGSILGRSWSSILPSSIWAALVPATHVSGLGSNSSGSSPSASTTGGASQPAELGRQQPDGVIAADQTAAAAGERQVVLPTVVSGQDLAAAGPGSVGAPHAASPLSRRAAVTSHANAAVPVPATAAVDRSSRGWWPFWGTGSTTARSVPTAAVANRQGLRWWWVAPVTAPLMAAQQPAPPGAPQDTAGGGGTASWAVAPEHASPSHVTATAGHAAAGSWPVQVWQLACSAVDLAVAPAVWYWQCVCYIVSGGVDMASRLIELAVWWALLPARIAVWFVMLPYRLEVGLYRQIVARTLVPGIGVSMSNDGSINGSCKACPVYSSVLTVECT